MKGEYYRYKLGEICARLSSGKGIQAKSIKRTGKYPAFGGNGVRGYVNKYNFDGKCAIIGRQGANCGNVRFFSGRAYLTEHAIAAVANNQHSTQYLAYLLGTMDLGRLSTQSAQPGISVQALSGIDLMLPSLDTQNGVVAVISSLDSKIENNNRINRTLEQMAQAIFKSWFVNFEPFGGEMPVSWKLGRLGDIAEVYDHKRVPLSSRQRCVMEKKFPYYGAASLMDYVDDFIFDGIYLLMGEDGTVIDDSGFPILQYVWGKFWVNNHAHVLRGKNGFSTESLHVLLSMTNVAAIVTGAVQAKINQVNLKTLPIVIPDSASLDDLNTLIEPMYAMIRRNADESNTLTKLRNTLLPRLMSGELTISEAERLV